MSYRIQKAIENIINDKKNIRTTLINLINFPIEHLQKFLNHRKNNPKKIFGLILGKKLTGYLSITIEQFIKKKDRTRRYLKKNQTFDSLFRELNKRKVKYVVLRWFDQLSNLTQNEDIDLLVFDNDLTKIKDLFSYFPGGHPFDVYSNSGLSGSAYNGLPYYPPHIANRILDNRAQDVNGVYHPNKKEYFISLAYHTVFHKGEKSGLPNDKGEQRPSEHDYGRILANLANELRIESIKPTFRGYYEYLKSTDWVPEFDTLRKLSIGNEWLVDLLPQIPQVSNLNEGEFIVFLIRESAVKYKKIDLILKTIKEKMDILFIHQLSQDEKKRASINIRGGKWDKGPYPKNGGEPEVIICCFDYHPMSLKGDLKNKYPHINNAHILLKNVIRDKINRDFLPFSHMNCIHAADDEVEAWKYLDIIAPQLVTPLQREVKDRRDRYVTKFPVIRDLDSNHTRSKVEVILYQGKKAVKKTYKKGRERFLEREIFVMQNFANQLDTIPDLLEFSESYFIIPFYDNILDERSTQGKKEIIKSYGQKIVDTIKFFYNNNYALIGFYAGNLLITSEGNLKIVDFEFLYEYKNKPKTFKQAYEISGLPVKFDGDLPRGISGKGHNFNNTWGKFLGSIDSYL